MEGLILRFHRFIAFTAYKPLFRSRLFALGAYEADIHGTEYDGQDKHEDATYGGAQRDGECERHVAK